MENDIYKIYHNSFGISFQWMHSESKKRHKKIQIVFRNMGFYLSKNEIKEFYNCIYHAKQSQPCSCCKDCDSRNILVRTPSDKVDIALNTEELTQVEDLIKGTLFQLDLDNYLHSLCKN
ncbi:hypothetical protein GCM10022271_05590 [Corallibacter vietnamensis]|uniref:Uncharacterized protein n=1 Tax=Corallibacter vietnamensis TaxID=904130 RepID=A0ABP7GX69_9FLAO